MFHFRKGNWCLPDSLSLTAYRKLTRQLIKKLLDVVFKTKVSINVDRFFPLKTERKGTRKVSLSAFEYRTVHSENCYYFSHWKPSGKELGKLVFLLLNIEQYIQKPVIILINMNISWTSENQKIYALLEFWLNYWPYVKRGQNRSVIWGILIP